MGIPRHLMLFSMAFGIGMSWRMQVSDQDI